MSELISIVIPVYKVQDFLDRCVKSVVSQTYTNIEVILVDDGSPDKCSEMCDRWAEQDSRIVVIHKKNGGLSDARNWGIRTAKGEYIAFVDSDDYIHPRFLEILYYFMKKENADVVACTYERTLKKDEQTDFKVIQNEQIEVETGRKADAYITNDGIVAWNKLYKRELFEKIQFPVGRIHEDNGIIWMLRYYAKRIIVVKESLYYYFQNTDGIMNSSVSCKCLDGVENYFDQYNYFLNIKEDVYANEILESCLNCYPSLCFELKKKGGWNKKNRKIFCDSYQEKVKVACGKKCFGAIFKIKHLVYSYIPICMQFIYKNRRVESEK